MERLRSIVPPNKALEPTAGYPGKLHAGASGRRLKVGRPFGAVDVLFRDQYHTLLMKQTDMDALEEVIRSHWPYALDAKAERYLNKFFDRTRVGNGIAAKVVGNHGTYAVSIVVKGGEASSACSCYIGRDGRCHHCDALAHTFLDDPESFQIVEQKELRNVRTPEDLQAYLKGVTLDSLIKDLKAEGITQKQFAESIGMNARQLSAIKASELRNRYFNELGAVKLACLWMLERFRKLE